MRNNKILSLLLLLGGCGLLLGPGAVRAGHLEPFKSTPISEINPQTPAKVELGKKLFFDRRLSGDGTMSCVTCHIPALGFTDGQSIALSYPTTKNWRNTQTLINIAFSTYLFHDGRAETLEDQALFPIMSSFEMNQNLDALEEEIRAVPEYVREFTAVFGTDDITRERIAMAIAAFERTLVSRNAPLDRYLNGETEALSAEAKAGMEIFTGKGRCVTCHGGVSLMDNDFHALNVPENPDFENDPRVAATRRFVAKVNHYEDFRNLKEDPGRFLITKNKEDWRAFKTPTLRDIDRTGPYMHNGIFETLEEVIAFLDRGQSSPIIQPLGLSEQEKKALKTFLVEALTGEEIELEFPQVP